MFVVFYFKLQLTILTKIARHHNGPSCVIMALPSDPSSCLRWIHDQPQRLLHQSGMAAGVPAQQELRVAAHRARAVPHHAASRSL